MEDRQQTQISDNKENKPNSSTNTVGVSSRLRKKRRLRRPINAEYSSHSESSSGGEEGMQIDESSEEEWGNESKGADKNSKLNHPICSSSSSEEDNYSCVEEIEEESKAKKKGNTKASQHSLSFGKNKTSTNSSFFSPVKRNTAKSSLFTPSPSNSCKSSSSIVKNTPQTPSATVVSGGNHAHDNFPWLKPENIRDKDQNKPTSPLYNCRTLYVPASFLSKATPAMQQWWKIKSENMDTVLFFKVGKFYELFHMDADIGVRELDCIYMKGDKAHSGFPEIAYAKMATALVEKGYKVARVEQTQTPQMMKEANVKKAKKQKVVLREICSVLTPGTNTRDYLSMPSFANATNASDTVNSKNKQLIEQNGGGNKYLLSVTALLKVDENVAKFIDYGVCLLDVTTGAFHVGFFTDNKQRDKLRTLLAQFLVSEIVCEENSASEKYEPGLDLDTVKVLKYGTEGCKSKVCWTMLKKNSEFYNANETIEQLTSKQYFVNDEGEQKWPVALQHLMDQQQSDEYHIRSSLALSALGGCLWNLQRSLIDHEVISLCNFSIIDFNIDGNSMDSNDSKIAGDSSNNTSLTGAPDYMILDGQTIANLEILVNSSTNTSKGSLLELMDSTVTPFGKRLFRQWILHPLVSVSEIKDRLDAIENLIALEQATSSNFIGLIRQKLRLLPDLERLMMRIHSLGSAYRSSDQHPESRAIMYENTIYNKRKIKDFLSTLNGFSIVWKLIKTTIPDAISSTAVTSCILNKIFHIQENGLKENCFPNISDQLDFFGSAFDHKESQEKGVIIPLPGVNKEYDSVLEDIADIERDLELYLKEKQEMFKTKNIQYWGSKKEERFQLEIPEHINPSKKSENFELKSKKKGFKRYHTPQIKEYLANLIEAEERKDAQLKNQMRLIFHRFDSFHSQWNMAIQKISILDCILSLTVLSQNNTFIRPEFIENSKSPVLDLQQSVHPCLANAFEEASGEEFIPNDICLKKDEDEQNAGLLLLLSGPNMGGKSTLLRQSCLLVIMAQMGSFVPCTRMRLTSCDRIFTRLGASDRILQGQSTFYVELAETSTILNKATNRSLVILDELGRGTSTFDGTAIAYAVIEYLVHKIGCRTLFATHYHSLVEEYSHSDSGLVSLKHMDCLVEETDVRNENNENMIDLEVKKEEKVTFLYKLVDGLCPKSYGINVARLAQLPSSVLKRASEKAHQFQLQIQSNCSVALPRAKIMETMDLICACVLRSNSMESQDKENAVNEIRQLWENLQEFSKVL